MLDGQASVSAPVDNAAPAADDDLVSFLIDNPEADNQEDEPNGDAPAKADNADTATDDIGPADDALEDSDASDNAKQTSDIKFKFTVPGADGKPETVELDEKGVKDSYLRHADYTRGMQGLANKGREIEATAMAQVQQVQTYYTEQAQLAHAAISRLASLRTADEMAQLAQVDPAAWVSESQRQTAIRGVLGELEQGLNLERSRAAQMADQNLKAASQTAWVELRSKGIDRPALVKIYQSMTEQYGIDQEMLGTVYSAKAVQVMRDALAYQDLVKRRGAVTKQVKEAPRLPSARQRVPEKEQLNNGLNKRFQSGRAGLDDLAKFIANN